MNQAQQPGGRGGRGNSRRGRGGSRGRNNNNGTGSSKFEGQEPLLKGCVFDYTQDAQAKKYIHNVELLIGYIGIKFPKYNMDFQRGVEKLSLPTPQRPQRPANTASPIEFKEWEFEYKAVEEKRVPWKVFNHCCIVFSSDNPQT